MMNFKTFIGATAVAAGIALAGSAQAAPMYTQGSFAFVGFTSATGDVTSTTNFPLSPASITIGSPANDMTLISLPATLGLTGAADFSDPSTFSFSDPVLGTFTATSASLLGTVTGNNASATWDIEGSFVLGTGWSNATDMLTANETWTLNQTGGPGASISISGTFNAPAVTPPPVGTPEPATLAIIGAGLAGMGMMRRRKKAVA